MSKWKTIAEICAREQRRSRREMAGLKKGERRMSDDEELERRDRRERLNKHYDVLVKEALSRFGQWDVADPVVWKLLHVVKAQNQLSAAYLAHATGEGPESMEDLDRMVDAALAERREAIEALRQARSEDEETNEYDRTGMTKLRYVLYVEPEEEVTLISVHSTKAAAEAELRKFAAEFLDARVPLVACKIFGCPADGRPGAEATSLVLQSVLTQLKQAGLI
jgi:hypothetical protein